MMAGKTRDITGFTLVISFLIFTSLILNCYRVTAQQKYSSHQNADGSSTTIETLAGGGAKATTRDTSSKIIDTVTTVPNSKYGDGGAKITVQTAVDGQDVDIESYRDASGQIREVAYTNFGPKDQIKKYEFKAAFNKEGYLESYDEKLNNKDVPQNDPYPEEGGDSLARIRSQIQSKAAKFISKGDEITQARFGTNTPGLGIKTDAEQPDMSKPTTEPSTKTTKPEESKDSKQPKTETPSTPSPTKTNGDSALPEPSTSAEVVEGKVPGYSTTIKTPPGLFTTVFTTPSRDVIEVYLPRDLVAGETVLGSMKVIPAKPNVSSIPLSFQIGLGDYIEVWNKPFTVKLDDQPLTKLRFLDQKKKPVAEVDFHTSQKPKQLSNFSVPSEGTQLSDFYLPSSGTYGNLLIIQAKELIKLDELLKPSGSVLIGDLPMPIIVATPHEIITRIDYDKPGVTDIEIKQGNTDYKRPFRVLTLNLSADSLNLLKGESTTVHIVVHGLENLHVPAHMKIVVTGTVTMTGATEVEIQPSDISSTGTYATNRTLHAVEAGGFGVTVTVTVDKELRVVYSNKKGESDRSRL